MIEALACPECHAESYRALGAHGLGVRVSCELCGCVYLLPSARRLRERADRYWQLDEPSYHKPRTAGTVEPAPVASSRWARLWRLWRALLAEWRGDA